VIAAEATVGARGCSKAGRLEQGPLFCWVTAAQFCTTSGWHVVKLVLYGEVAEWLKALPC